MFEDLRNQIEKFTELLYEQQKPNKEQAESHEIHRKEDPIHVKEARKKTKKKKKTLVSCRLPEAIELYP